MEAQLVEEEWAVVRGDGEVEVGSVDDAIQSGPIGAVDDSSQERRLWGRVGGEEHMEAVLLYCVVQDFQLLWSKGLLGEDEGCDLVGVCDEELLPYVFDA